MTQSGKEACDTLTVAFADAPPRVMRIERAAAQTPDLASESSLWEPLFVTSLALLLSAVCAVFFHLIFTRNIGTDLQPHIQIISISLQEHSWLPNFLYYWTVALCAGFSPELSRLQNATVFVMTASCCLRFLVSVWVGRQLLRENSNWDQRRDLRYAFYVIIALLQVTHNVFDVYKDTTYMGYFPANVWHNSTTIFLMPWAILMFYFAYRAVTRTAASDLWMLALTGVINVAIKCSLVQVLLVVVPIAAVLRYRISAKTVKIGLALLPAVAFVGLQFVLLYTPYFSGSVLARYHEDLGVSGESRVAFEFLALWPPHTLSTILCSFMYPIVVLALFRKQLARESLFIFAVGCLTVGLLVFMCLVETGYRRMHGNFTWQVFICTYLLFLSVIIIQFRHLLRRDRPQDRDLLPAIPYALHVVCGLIYMGMIIVAANGR